MTEGQRERSPSDLTEVQCEVIAGGCSHVRVLARQVGRHVKSIRGMCSGRFSISAVVDANATWLRASCSPSVVCTIASLNDR
jgi:hypothetical protein